MSDLHCIICREPIDMVSIIYPCSCNYPRHRSCLYKWLKLAPPRFKTRCEVCHKKYSINGPNSIRDYNDNIINYYINNPRTDVITTGSLSIGRTDICGFYQLQPYQQFICMTLIMTTISFGFILFFHTSKNLLKVILFMASIMLMEFVLICCLFQCCEYFKYNRSRTRSQVIPIDV